MIGLYVSVPVACFRKGLAREYLETEQIPPPSTCYGFLLSLVGETRRARPAGCRVAPGLFGQPSQSVVLRTVWRVKKTPLGSSGNTRPDYQQLLTGIKALIWLDSTDEPRENVPTLEERVTSALQSPHAISRFGGLWIAFIGWFLLQAADESLLETSLSGILQNATVALSGTMR